MPEIFRLDNSYVDRLVRKYEKGQEQKPVPSYEPAPDSKVLVQNTGGKAFGEGWATYEQLMEEGKAMREAWGPFKTSSTPTTTPSPNPNYQPKTTLTTQNGLPKPQVAYKPDPEAGILDELGGQINHWMMGNVAPALQKDIESPTGQAIIGAGKAGLEAAGQIPFLGALAKGAMGALQGYAEHIGDPIAGLAMGIKADVDYPSLIDVPKALQGIPGLEEAARPLREAAKPFTDFITRDLVNMPEPTHTPQQFAQELSDSIRGDVQNGNIIKAADNTWQFVRMWGNGKFEDATGMQQLVAGLFADPLNFVGLEMITGGIGYAQRARSIAQATSDMTKVADTYKDIGFFGRVANVFDPLPTSVGDELADPIKTLGLAAPKESTQLRYVNPITYVSKSPMSKALNFVNRAQDYVMAVAAKRDFSRNGLLKLFEYMSQAAKDKNITGLKETMERLGLTNSADFQRTVHGAIDFAPSNESKQAWEHAAQTINQLNDWSNATKPTLENLSQTIIKPSFKDMLKEWNDAPVGKYRNYMQSYMGAFQRFETDLDRWSRLEIKMPELKKALHQLQLDTDMIGKLQLSTEYADNAQRQIQKITQLPEQAFYEKFVNKIRPLESALFITSNPHAIAVNAIGNWIVSAAHGISPWESQKNINRFFGRVYGTEDTKAIMTRVGDKLAEAVGDTRYAHDLPMGGKAPGILSKSPLGKLWVKAENGANVRAYMKGYREVLSQKWRYGKEIPPMPTELEQAIRASIGKKQFKRLIASMEDSYNTTELKNASNNFFKEPRWQEYRKEIAANLSAKWSTKLGRTVNIDPEVLDGIISPGSSDRINLLLKSVSSRVLKGEQLDAAFKAEMDALGAEAQKHGVDVADYMNSKRPVKPEGVVDNLADDASEVVETPEQQVAREANKPLFPEDETQEDIVANRIAAEDKEVAELTARRDDLISQWKLADDSPGGFKLANDLSAEIEAAEKRINQILRTRQRVAAVLKDAEKLIQNPEANKLVGAALKGGDKKELLKELNKGQKTEFNKLMFRAKKVREELNSMPGRMAFDDAMLNGSSIDDAYKAGYKKESEGLRRAGVEPNPPKDIGEGQALEQAGIDDPRLKGTEVVDEEGNPLRVYHATTKSFKKFNIPTSKDARHPTSLWGYWFSSNPEQVDDYISDGAAWLTNQYDEGANIIPAYLRIEKPYKMSFNDWQDMVDIDSYKGSDKLGRRYDDIEQKEFVEGLKSKGHDGIVISEPDGNKMYVTFNHNQIVNAFSGELMQTAPKKALSGPAWADAYMESRKRMEVVLKTALKSDAKISPKQQKGMDEAKAKFEELRAMIDDPAMRTKLDLMDYKELLKLKNQELLNSVVKPKKAAPAAKIAPTKAATSTSNLDEIVNRGEAKSLNELNVGDRVVFKHTTGTKRGIVIFNDKKVLIVQTDAGEQLPIMPVFNRTVLDTLPTPTKSAPTTKPTSTVTKPPAEGNLPPVEPVTEQLTARQQRARNFLKSFKRDDGKPIGKDADMWSGNFIDQVLAGEVPGFAAAAKAYKNSQEDIKPILKLLKKSGMTDGQIGKLTRGAALHKAGERGLNLSTTKETYVPTWNDLESYALGKNVANVIQKGQTDETGNLANVLYNWRKYGAPDLTKPGGKPNLHRMLDENVLEKNPDAMVQAWNTIADYTPRNKRTYKVQLKRGEFWEQFRLAFRNLTPEQFDDTQRIVDSWAYTIGKKYGWDMDTTYRNVFAAVEPGRSYGGVRQLNPRDLKNILGKTKVSKIIVNRKLTLDDVERAKSISIKEFNEHLGSFTQDYTDDPDELLRAINGDNNRLRSNTELRDRLRKEFGAENEAIPLYHGTWDISYDKVDKSRLREDSLWGPGYYMTDDPRVANNYVEKEAIGGGRQISRKVDVDDIFKARNWTIEQRQRFGYPEISERRELGNKLHEIDKRQRERLQQRYKESIAQGLDVDDNSLYMTGLESYGDDMPLKQEIDAKLKSWYERARLSSDNFAKEYGAEPRWLWSMSGDYLEWDDSTDEQLELIAKFYENAHGNSNSFYANLSAADKLLLDNLTQNAEWMIKDDDNLLARVLGIEIEEYNPESHMGVKQVYARIENPFDVDAPADKEFLEYMSEYVRQRAGEYGRQLADELRYELFDDVPLELNQRRTNGELYEFLTDSYEGKGIPKSAVRDAMHEFGYDGIRYNGGMATNGKVKHNAWVAFEPNEQVINAFTGELMQLDTRSQIRDNISRFVSKSTVKDPVYHGTAVEVDFDTFKKPTGEIGIHFGENPGQSETVILRRFGFSPESSGIMSDKDKARIGKFYIRLENPLELEDQGTWSFYTIMPQLLQKNIITSAEYHQIDEIFDRTEQARAMEALIKSKGYDGFKYKNSIEHGGAYPLVELSARQEARAREVSERMSDIYDAEMKKAVDDIANKDIDYWTIQQGVREGLETNPEYSKLQKIYESEYKVAAQVEQSARKIAEKKVEYSYAVLEPNQIKSAYASKFDPQDNSALMQESSQPSDMFYSKLLREAQTLPMDKMSAEQARNMLVKAGVKKDEMYWAGLDNFFGEWEMVNGSARLSKKDLIDHIKAYEPKLTEQIRGDGDFDRPSVRKKRGAEKFDVRGGKDYKEITLSYKLPGSVSPKKIFESPHFPEDGNVVVHVRGDTRTNFDGEKTFFIQEIQSDWGQKFREQSDLPERFKGMTREEIEIERDLIDEALIDLAEKLNLGLKNGGNALPKIPLELEDTYREFQELNILANKLDESSQGFAPEGPFIDDTKKWTDLAVKRMMRYAAEEGFDRIAWVGGKDKLLSGSSKGVAAYYDNFVPESFDRVGKRWKVKNERTDITLDKTQKRHYGLVNAEDMEKLYPDSYRVTNIIPPEHGEFWQVVTPDGKMASDDIMFSIDAAVDKANALNKSDGLEEITWRMIPDKEESRNYFQSIKITDEMRESITRDGFPLFQKEGEGKGSAIWRSASGKSLNGRAIIRALTKSHDVSTAIHEVSHAFLPWLPTEEMDIFEKWAKLKPGEFKRLHEQYVNSPYGMDFRSVEGKRYQKAQEDFARGFEEYMAKGESPIKELEPLFKRFANWLKKIYGGITGTDIEKNISPEMRGLYDRLMSNTKKDLDNAISRSKSGPDLDDTFDETIDDIVDELDDGKKVVPPKPTPEPEVEAAADQPPPMEELAEEIDPQFEELAEEVNPQFEEPIEDAIAPERKVDDEVELTNDVVNAVQQFMAGEMFAPMHPMPAELRAQFNKWMKKEVRPRLFDTTLAAQANGRWYQEHTVLNYSNRWNVDDALSLWAPFTYWPLHMAVNMTQKFADKPALLNYYLRTKQAYDEWSNSQANGMPERFKGRIRIPMRGLPDFMEDSIWVNPFKTLFPVEDIYQVDKLERAGYTTMNAAEGEGAPPPDAKGFMEDLFSPHLPTKLAMQLLQGDQSEVEDTLANLPPVRILKGLGLVGLDNPLKIGDFSPTRSKWDAFYIEAALRNMLAEGKLGDTKEESTAAFNETLLRRAGPVWDKAMERARLENYTASVVPGFLGFTGKAYTMGEQIYAGTRLEYNRMMEEILEKDGVNPNGTRDQKYEYLSRNGYFAKGTPLQVFRESHPELEGSSIRSERSKTDDELLYRGWLTDSIHAKLAQSTELEKRFWTNELGNEFKENFYLRENRDYDKIPTEQLSGWATALRVGLPEVSRDSEFRPPQNQAYQVTFPSQKQSTIYAAYKANIDKAIGEDNYHKLQDQYNAMKEQDPKAAKEWLKTTEGKMLITVWDFNDEFYKDNPDILRLLELAGLAEKRAAQAPAGSDQQKSIAWQQSMLAAGYSDYDEYQAERDAYYALPEKSQARRDYLNQKPRLIRMFEISNAIYDTDKEILNQRAGSGSKNINVNPDNYDLTPNIRQVRFPRPTRNYGLPGGLDWASLGPKLQILSQFPVGSPERLAYIQQEPEVSKWIRLTPAPNMRLPYSSIISGRVNYTPKPFTQFNMNDNKRPDTGPTPYKKKIYTK